MIVTCLLGDPVEHSVSNYLFNYYAKQFNLEYAHVKLRVDSTEPNNLEVAIDALRKMNFAGANITLPYKLEVMKYLDDIDLTAQKIGAVNTIVNKNGMLTGYNTDAFGSIETVKNRLPKLNNQSKVTILGAGGACRAILYEILKITKTVTVLNRSEQRLEHLYANFQDGNSGFKCELLSKESLEKNITDADLIINTTSVGMSPNDCDTLIPVQILSELKHKKSFFDVVFNPEPTRFLINADKYGHNTVGGMRMMIYQGIKAFELWTGKHVSDKSVNRAYKLLTTHLHG